MNIHSLHEIREAANGVEAYHGPNAYTGFLRKHGRRPTPAEAGTIGKLMSARVMADDGKLYPPLSLAQREERRRARDAWKERHAASERVGKLRSMLTSWAPIGRAANSP